MERLLIKKTEESPAVIFIPEKGKFQIVGTSWLENPDPFYKKIMDWLSNYFINPLNETVFEIQLDYFNTASAKHIVNLLKFLKINSKIYKIRVKWYYKPEDMDILTEIHRYKTLLDMDILEPTELTTKTTL